MHRFPNEMNISPELEYAFFPVCEKPIYTDQSWLENSIFDSSKMKKVPGYKAIARKENGHVISIVSNNYRLITNRTAYELGKKCFMQVFGRDNADSMEFFNLRMTTSGNSCTMDFFAKDESVYLLGDSNNAQEEWKAFLRIGNSYNRVTALRVPLFIQR